MMKQLINNELHFDGFRNKFGMTGCAEHGRSMVEMLGVLAVMGVLSVAGIAGYSIAMRSHRTNEIVNATSMFYVLAKSQNQGNGPIGDIDYATVGGTNPSGATLAYTNNAFTITFTDSDDCTMAANKLGDKATADCANKKITVNFGESAEEDNGACPSGTSEENTGGSVSNKVECKCPTNKKWDSSSKTCINDDGSQELYVLGNTDTHYNLTANGAGCPTGYHWASFSEFFKDYNCRSGGQGYPCDISFTFGYSFLRDCAAVDTSNTAQMDTPTLECDNSSDAYTPMTGYGLGPTQKSENHPALCRR